MSKGGDWERDACRMFSLWWSEDSRDDIFWRTSASGARATMRIKEGKDTAYSFGDMTFTDPIGKPLIDLALVELKRGYTATSKPIKLADITKTLKEIDGIGRCNVDLKVKKIRALFSKSKTNTGVGILNIVDGKREVENEELYKWWLKAETERELADRPYSMVVFRRDNKEACVMINLVMYLAFMRIAGAPPYHDPRCTLNIGIRSLDIIRLDTFFKWVKPWVIKRLLNEEYPKADQIVTRIKAPKIERVR